MGRGSSKIGGGAGGGGTLYNERKQTIIDGIKNHTSQQNDRAETFYKNNIAKEKDIIDNYSKYVQIGKIKDKNDPWWQYHEDTYKSLVAQYDFFKKERKKQGR